MSPIWERISGWYAVAYTVTLTSGDTGERVMLVPADTETLAAEETCRRLDTHLGISHHLVRVHDVRPIAQGIIPGEDW